MRRPFLFNDVDRDLESASRAATPQQMGKLPTTTTTCNSNSNSADVERLERAAALWVPPPSSFSPLSSSLPSSSSSSSVYTSSSYSSYYDDHEDPILRRTSPPSFSTKQGDLGGHYSQNQNQSYNYHYNYNETELSRIHTQRSQHSGTVGARDRDSARYTDYYCYSKKPLPAFGAGKPFPPPLPEREAYVVEFDGPDDPLHAQNWPLGRKIFISTLMAFTTLLSTLGSSIFTSMTRVIGEEFNVSAEVAMLGVSLYVVGFALGPTGWAPLSELYGRRGPLLVSTLGFAVFSIGTAAAKDLQTVLVCRFFAGLCGACPLAVVPAAFADLYDHRARGGALTLFGMTVFTGPLLSPLVAGWMVDSLLLSWRWTEYSLALLGFAALALNLLFLPETYPPVILVGKARELRRRTFNWGIHARQEEVEVDASELATKNLSRPLRLLFGEPIVLLMSLYMSFIYGLLYLFLAAYPLVFQQQHGFSGEQVGLTFFGVIAGDVLAGVSILAQQPWYRRQLAANGGVPVPEWRLPSVIVGGVAFAGGIFWFGWSGYRADVHWIVPALSGLLSGFGLVSIFLQSLNYLVDAYLMFAASAVAGNAIIRSLAAAGFPLFAVYMFEGMGVQWAATLLGCLAAALVPIPVVFYVYGHKLRERSAFAPTPTASRSGSGGPSGSSSPTSPGPSPSLGRFRFDAGSSTDEDAVKLEGEKHHLRETMGTMGTMETMVRAHIVMPRQPCSSPRYWDTGTLSGRWV